MVKIRKKNEHLRRRRKFRKLRSILSDEDLKRIEEESKLFRKSFTLE